MLKRLNDIPVYSSAQITVDAAVFNTIRVATQRLSLPIRLSLPRFKYIDIIIDHDSWACVDKSLNDLPIIAWTEFGITARTALHLPITCTISNYHFQSGQVASGALNFTKVALENELSMLAAQTAQKASTNICAFPPSTAPLTLK